MKYIIIVAILMLTGCEFKTCDKETLPIIKVGGCNKNGYCGVIYAGGKKGKEYYPVEGEFVEVCK